MTCEPSAVADTPVQLGFSLAEYPASQPAEPGSSAEAKIVAGSGRRLSDAFPRSDLLGRFSRILLASETWQSTEFSLQWTPMTLPLEISETFSIVPDSRTSIKSWKRLRRKVTPSRFTAFRLQASTRRTYASDIGSWPTTRANGTKSEEWAPGKLEAKMQEARGQPLPRVLKASWVSPSATDASRGSLPPRPQDTGVPLNQMLATAWPTPDASEAGKTSRGGERIAEPLIGGIVRGWATPNASMAEGGGSKNGARPDHALETIDQCRGIKIPLNQMLKARWPTPKKSDIDGGAARADGTAPEKHHKMADYAIGITPYGCLARTTSFVARLMTLSMWLMGYTAAYLRHWETASSRKSRGASSPP